MFLRRFAPALLLVGAALLLPAGQAVAQATHTCPPPAPSLDTLKPADLQRDVRDRGFLWRLEKEGRVSWLYGTIHVSRLDWVIPGPRVQAALAGSDVLALELDPTDPELPRAFAAAGDAARAQRVASGLRERIARLAERECVPADRMARLAPMLQVMMVSLSQGRRDGFHPELAVDAMLWGLGQRLGRKFVGLETAQSQLAALTPATEADEKVLLQQTVDELESGAERDHLGRLLRAWAAGDAQELANYRQWCGCTETPAEQRFLAQVNDDRNTGMAARLAALHEGGSSFFAAVGSLHMTGPKALQELLRARGFQVQRVPFSGSTP